MRAWRAGAGVVPGVLKLGAGFAAAVQQLGADEVLQQIDELLHVKGGSAVVAVGRHGYVQEERMAC